MAQQYPFLSYETETFNVSNGGSQTYNVTYRCLIVVGDYRPDDTGGGFVRIEHNRRLQDSGDVFEYILEAEPVGGGDRATMGAAVALSGDVVRADAPDDMRVTIYIFRLP